MTRFLLACYSAFNLLSGTPGCKAITTVASNVTHYSGYQHDSNIRNACLNRANRAINHSQSAGPELSPVLCLLSIVVSLSRKSGLKKRNSQNETQCSLAIVVTHLITAHNARQT